MKTGNLNKISIVFLFVFGVLIVKSITPYGSFTSPDSLAYLDLASNISDGKGLVSTNFDIRTYKKKSFSEQRLWPPLYPVLIAFGSLFKPDTTSVSYISGCLIGINLVFFYLILSMYLHKGLSFVVSLLSFFTIPMIDAYSYVWSETLFNTEMIIFAWTILKFIKTEDIKYFVCFTLILTMMAFTRYIGIVFSVFFIPMFFIALKNRKLMPVFLFCILTYSAFVCSMLVDNYLVTSSITGGKRPPSELGIVDNLTDFFQSFKVILLSKFYYVVFSVIVSFSVIIFDGNRDHKTIPSDIYIVFFTAFFYYLVLIVLRTSSGFDRIDIRLISPVFQYVLIFLTVFSVRAGNLPSRFISLFLVFSLFINGYFLYSGMKKQLFLNGMTAVPSNYGGVYPNFTRDPDRDVYKRFISDDNVNKKFILISSRPMVCRFITGISSFGFSGDINISLLEELNLLENKGFLVLFSMEEKNNFMDLVKKYHIKWAKAFSLGSLDLISLPIKIGGK